MPAATQIRNERGAIGISDNGALFFDFRSDGFLSADDEGDADAAHHQPMGALVEGIRDIVLEGAKVASRSRFEAVSGASCKISAVLASEVFKNSNPSDTTYLTALHDIAARIGFSHVS